jgi:hypothetical protein
MRFCNWVEKIAEVVVAEVVVEDIALKFHNYFVLAQRCTRIRREHIVISTV